MLRDYPENTGPLEDTNAVEKFHDTCRIGIRSEMLIVFTHAALLPPNIMLTPGPRPRIAAIIDWEQSGWYPAYWEYCKVRRINQFPDPVHTEWVETYVPMLLTPVDEYTVYRGFVAYALARAFYRSGLYGCDMEFHCNTSHIPLTIAVILITWI